MAENLPGGVLSEGGYSISPAENDLILDWMGSFFARLDDDLPADVKSGIVKSCSASHYRFLNMDKTLAPFKGDLPGFLRFLEGTWGWKIELEEGGRVIRADENKSFCVCPLIQRGIIQRTVTLCSCSEGFAERMFAQVTGGAVSARVVRSVLRGDPSCVYQVSLLESGSRP